MRKFLIPLAAAASAVAFATPASAQIHVSIGQGYPPPAYGYGYGQPQGYGYGYGQPQGYGYGYNNHGVTRSIANRINHIQREIHRLARYRMISRNEYHNRIRDSREIERRFYRNARDGRGLTQRELYDVQVRLQRLEQRIHRDVRDGRQWRYRW